MASAARDTAYRDELTRLTPGLRQVARALVQDHNTETADDLVQATLVRALGVDQRRSGERLVVWLMSVLTGLHRSQVAGIHADQQVNGATRTAHHQAAGMPIARHAGGSPVAALPIECREVVLLVSLVRLSYAQVAEALGVSINTVLGRLARGRDHLARTSFGETFTPRPQSTAARRAVAPYLRVVK